MKHTIGPLHVTNTTRVPQRLVRQASRALAHWAPYRHVQVHVVPCPMLYRGSAWCWEQRIQIELGPSHMLPYKDCWSPKVPWGYIQTLTEAYVGLLAHELWHLRLHRRQQRQVEWACDVAAAHAIAAWKAGHRTKIPLPRAL